MTTGRVVDSYSNIHSVKLFAHHDRELDYAKEAIATDPRHLCPRDAAYFTIMDIVLTLLNGFLIVGGGVSSAGILDAVWLWAGDAATVGGPVAAATALTLRLNAMTGWIMWAVSTLFRSLGVGGRGDGKRSPTPSTLTTTRRTRAP